MSHGPGWHCVSMTSQTRWFHFLICFFARNPCYWALCGFILSHPKFYPNESFLITKHLQRQSPSFPLQHEPSSDAQACQRASTTSPGRGYQGPSKEHPAQGDAIRGWVGSPVTQTWEWDGNSLHRAKEQRGDEFAWWVKDQMHPWEDRNHAELVQESRGLVLNKNMFLWCFQGSFPFLKSHGISLPGISDGTLDFHPNITSLGQQYSELFVSLFMSFWDWILHAVPPEASASGILKGLNESKKAKAKGKAKAKART